MLILESVRYDRFLEADAPNMKGLGTVCKGYAHASWTRPSIASIFSGYLPRTEEYGSGPYNPTYRMLDKHMLGEDVPAYFFNSNAYAHDLQPRDYHEFFFDETKIQATKTVVQNAREIMKRTKQFFAAVFLIETHVNYHLEGENPKLQRDWANYLGRYINGEDNRAAEIAKERQLRAIHWIDKQIKPLLPLADRIIVIADHGDLQGEHHLIGHGCEFPFHPKLFEVPVILCGFA